MRILLVQPHWRSSGSGLGYSLAAMTEPLSLEMIAACAAGNDYRILDMRMDDDLVGAMQEFRPDMVGVTALTTEVSAAQEVLKQVKDFSSDIFTLVGGHHASLMPGDFQLPQVDAIALGEGEVVFPLLVEALSEHRPIDEVPNLIWQNGDGEWIANPLSDVRPDIDLLPTPRRDLTAEYRHEYFFLFDKPDSTLAASRGCPYRCNFCSVWKFYDGKTRQMSAERVVQEIAAVETDHITFVDDNFLTDYKREGAIADMIRSEGINKRYSIQCRTDSVVRHPELLKKWVDVGLYAALLGLEGSDDTLKNVNKKNNVAVNDEAIEILKDNGVIIWGCFIVDPDWTVDDFKRLRDYVTAKEITHTQFTVMTPLPGTVLWHEKYDELLTHDYDCYDVLHSVVPTRLPRQEFYKQFAGLYRQTDLGPYYDLVSEGKLTVEDCRQGKKMLDAMSQWEKYIPNDPVLGYCKDKGKFHAKSARPV